MKSFEQIFKDKLNSQTTTQGSTHSKTEISRSFKTDTLTGLFGLNLGDNFETQHNKKTNPYKLTHGSKLSNNKEKLQSAKVQPLSKKPITKVNLQSLTPLQLQAIHTLIELGAKIDLNELDKKKLLREYKKLVRFWHPDFNKSLNASSNLQKVTSLKLPLETISVE